MKRYQDPESYTGKRKVPGETLLAIACFTVIAVFVIVALLFG